MVSGGALPAIQLGLSVGTLVGSVLEYATQKPQALGRMNDLRITGSAYGVAIPWVWGRYRFGGNIIWWSDLRETRHKQGAKLAGTRVTTYSYDVDLAVLICRGPVTAVERIYAEDILIYDAVSGAGAEVQQISVGTNTSGNFQITFRGQTTATIAYNSAAGLIQSTLEALTPIGPGNILVTGPSGGPWLATFVGALAGQNVPRMDMLDGTLAGGSGQGISTVQQGATSYDVTIYLGDETQQKDPTISDAEGAANTPAYRGRCYVVLKDFDLSLWGNRLPNFSFIVRRSLDTYPEMVIRDGAYVYYRFEDTPGLLSDSTSQGFNLSVFSGTFTQISAGKYGEAISSAGIALAQRTTNNEPPFLADAMTTEVWFQYKGGSPGGSESEFTYYGGAVAWRIGVQPNLFVSQSILTWYQYDPTPPGFVSTIHQVSVTRDTAWHHLAVVVDTFAGTSKLYYDGVLQDTQTSVSTVTAALSSPTSLELRIVNDYRFDEVAFYPRALTAAEVALHANFVPQSAQLKHILQELMIGAGLLPHEFDVSQATAAVRGWALDNRTEARQAAEPPCRALMTDLVEVDGKIIAVPRGGAVVATIPDEDLGAVLTEGEPGEATDSVRPRRTGELELPFSLEVAYTNETTNFTQGVERALRPTKQHLSGQVTMPFPLVFTADEARALAEKLLSQTWSDRKPIEFEALPYWTKLAPADPVNLPVNGVLTRVRIEQQQIDLPGVAAFTAFIDDDTDVVSTQTGSVLTDQHNPFTFSVTTSLVIWNGNAARDEDADSVGLYAAANGAEGGDWQGADLWMSRDNGASYQFVTSFSDGGTFGTAATVLAAGTTTGLWDDANTVDVALTAGTTSPPVTHSDAEVLAGANGAVIGDEYLRFGTVTSLGGNSYRLSHLLRGQRGTDTFWDEHRIGERVVFDDGAIIRLVVDQALVNSVVLVKILGVGQVLADVSPVTVHLYGRELLAWSPAQFTGTRDGSNNLALTWHRRSRIMGDLADYTDVPLDFQTESYVVKVPSLTATTVTALTPGQQTVITAAGHGLVAGNEAYVSGIVGMTPLNNQTLLVVSVSGANVTFAVDSRDFPSYVSGGTLKKIVRTLSSSTNSVTYSAANQTTDGFSPPTPILLWLAQVGDDGRYGYPTVATI